MAELGACGFITGAEGARRGKGRKTKTSEDPSLTGQSIPQSIPWASEIGEAVGVARVGGQTSRPGASVRTGCVHLALTNPHELWEAGLLTAPQAAVFASPTLGRDGSLDPPHHPEAGWPGPQHRCPQSYSEQRRERACNNWLLHYYFITMRDD